MSTELPSGLIEPAFDANAMRVLKERYFAKKADGSLETPAEFLWRVAAAIAQPERPYAEQAGRDGEAAVESTARVFYEMLARRDFMPNTPCLVNAGRPLSMLSACFVLPVPDSIEGIFYNLQAMALIQKSGGGTGYAFSELRANGALVESTGKDASGPVSFMKVFNAATDSIKQGGVRRGANMGVLRVDHPDVFGFMRCKKELDSENRAVFNRLSDTGRYTEAQLAHIKQELLQTQMNNFNISIGVTDAFMAAVESDGDFDLIDPRTKTVVRTVRAREIWDGIVEGAWQNGEPGVLFLDHPQWNPLPGLGPIQATNPCVTADTWVTTNAGAQQVKDLIGRPFIAIVDGRPFASTEAGFFFTGVKPVFEVRTDRGFALKATADHPVRVQSAGGRVWKKVGELSMGDAIVLHDHAAHAGWDGEGSLEDGWLVGSFVGHGAARRAGTAIGVRRSGGSSETLAPSFVEELARQYDVDGRTCRVSAAIESASSDFTRGFLKGWFDADGALETAEHGPTLRLHASANDLTAAQRMLARLGVVATIAGDSLRIGDYALARFAAAIGSSDARTVAALPSGFNERVRSYEERDVTHVTTIAPVGLLPVYDCSVPGPNAFDANGLYVHNCGEQALHGYDSCNLGSINVGHFFDSTHNDVDWDRLGHAVSLAIRFLDNVIDANLYPIDEIRQMVTNNRRVGLGIMGFADLLVQLRVAYGSPAAIALAEKLMQFMQTRAEDMSETLARERGEFPNKHLSTWADDPRPRRNAALLSIAPTGTISMIAGCSFGCEPYFGIAYTKHVMKDAEGRPQHLYYVLPLFEEIATDEGFFSDAILAKVEENRGSLKGIAEVPALWQEVFTVAADVSVDQHIDMLAAFQKYTCNAVSKTINAPNDDTRDNVARSIFRAYRSGCKGFTYYRDGSRTEQVVTFSKDADISGVNRDAAPAASSAEAVESASAIVKEASAADSLEALLARAQALLGGK